MTTQLINQAIEALWVGVREINRLGGAKEAVPLHEAIAALRAARDAQPSVLVAKATAQAKLNDETAQERLDARDLEEWALGAEIDLKNSAQVIRDLLAEAAARDAQPVELTDEQIAELWANVPKSQWLTNAKSPWLWELLIGLSRAVERAHGITAKKEQP